MLASRLTLRKVGVAWAVLLLSAALVLPNLGYQTRLHPTMKVIIGIYWVLLLIGTPVALIAYFDRAWRRLGEVPNRGAYVIWLSLESIAALAFLALLAYSTVIIALAGVR